MTAIIASGVIIKGNRAVVTAIQRQQKTQRIWLANI